MDDRLTDRPPVGQAIDVDQIQGVAVVLEVQITPRHRKEAHRTTNRTNPGGLEALWASFPKIEKFPKTKRNRLQQSRQSQPASSAAAILQSWIAAFAHSAARLELPRCRRQ